MVRLPLLISVPHAGKDIPAEVKSLNLLSQEEIAADGDVGAVEIYNFADHVDQYVTTSIARAYVDMNRDPVDIRKDGVVKNAHMLGCSNIFLSPFSSNDSDFNKSVSCALP